MRANRPTAENDLARTLETAARHWTRQEYGKYFEILERASRMHARNHGVLLDLGSAYGMRYDYATAEHYFDRAVAVAPRKSEALTMAGVLCRGFNQYEMARRYFERAAGQSDASPDTFVKLAELYERLRLLDDAARMVDRALRLDGGNVLALLVRARLERLSGRLDEAERLARSFVSGSDPSTWSTRIRGWYELGAILDRQGRYDQAMEAFLSAKALIRPAASQHLAAQRLVHTRLKEVEASASAELLARWASAGEALQPPRRLTMLCGHPRSGTTLLEQVLDAHPEIVSAEETTVFMYEAYLPLWRGLTEAVPMLPVLDSASADALRQSRDRYFRCMEMFLGHPIDQRLLIDKNPSLTAVVPGIARIFPEAKFLLALRDPRDVCLSCFMQPLPLTQVSATFLSLEETAKEYASVMGLWNAIAPRMQNPYLEVRYEDVVDDLERVARRVLDFLGLPWDAGVLRFDERARNKLVRSPTYADVARPISKGAVGRWRNYQKYFEPCLEELAPFVRGFGYE